ncbi:MAG: 1-acyl-sn-glycerol-3-phosphate acyltransferase [Bacteroidales bacterium]|nr:1-acyl-sn-glycerol-3-phosphate acyltransferase [Bacteroidales bacterium]
MKRFLSKHILRLAGWKSDISVEIPEKCVICVAPHTSNWDFIIGKLFYVSIGKEASFLIKDSWFFFPLNYLFHSMGGVPVDRSKSGELTQQMADLFLSKSRFQLAITPEGTRKLSPQWKKGFYYIALKSKVPIVLATFDYEKKIVGINRIFEPTGDEDADLKEIKLYYRNVTACHPEKFSIGEI